ncbi:XdhC/CoxI family protein [Pseudonocardiaceae bacterium YIM PH 21723]|nr:XdhC/CoxI family protein [Pseudonocardiaceae bacterium YIM PH 21723]
MTDIVAELASWAVAGHRFAVVGVIGVHGSGPRNPGLALAVREDGAVAGSVSGGCVEAEVYELAREVLATGVAARRSFGFDPDDPFAAGLTCGGELEVAAWPADPALAAAVVAAADHVPVALATVTDGPVRLLGRSVAVFADHHVGGFGCSVWEPAAVARARTMLEEGRTGQAAEVFVQSFAAPPKMLLFGATDNAAALAHLGRFLGYHVVVCDARATFTTAERFPDAHEVVVEWPHRYLARTGTDGRTVVCVLSHDPKFEIPLLVEALRRPLGFVGALGSRATQADRVRRLRAEGVPEESLAGLRAPVGLDLGGRTAQETALSIVAEVVALRHGGSAVPLGLREGPIHQGRLSRRLG